MKEVLHVIKVPKSKMQTIREYTDLRAFAEIGDNGSPIAYFIESHRASTVKRIGVQTNSATTKRTVNQTSRSVVLGPNTMLERGTRCEVNPGTNLYMVQDIVWRFIKNSHAIQCPRKVLTTKVETETNLRRGDISSNISKLIQLGSLRVVDK